MELTRDIAGRFARTALGHVTREYPHKLDHVLDSDADALPPRSLHPCFYGSFDWHSCVHGWWTLLTVRRLFPDLPEAAAIAALADDTFTSAKLDAELSYLERASSRGFERPYGWAWLLYLHLEASRHVDRDWGTRLEPLARAFSARLTSYLEILTYPITVGTHPNSAFALTLAADWAEAFDPSLHASIGAWVSSAFTDKSDYAGWEPGGDEFLSPVLTAALVVSKVVPRAEFAAWFDRLVVTNGWLERHCHPVTVSDRSDGKIAHLDGLNLSRAWCLLEIRRALGSGDDTMQLRAKAEQLYTCAFDHVTGDYAGEHWLASFALLAALAADPPAR